MAMSFSRNPTGSVGLGLFLIALGPFALSVFLPFDMFLSHFSVSLVAGALLAVVLAGRRRPRMPHVDPRWLDDTDRERP